jgi:hypothetical protein
MNFRHKYIFSASTNEKSYQAAARKQSGVTVIPMNGGMTEVHQCSHGVACQTHVNWDETKPWFTHHDAKLPFQYTKLLCHITTEVALVNNNILVTVWRYNEAKRIECVGILETGLRRILPTAKPLILKGELNS